MSAACMQGNQTMVLCRWIDNQIEYSTYIVLECRRKFVASNSKSNSESPYPRISAWSREVLPIAKDRRPAWWYTRGQPRMPRQSQSIEAGCNHHHQFSFGTVGHDDPQSFRFRFQTNLWSWSRFESNRGCRGVVPERQYRWLGRHFATLVPTASWFVTLWRCNPIRLENVLL